MQLGVHPVAVVGKLVKNKKIKKEKRKKKRDSYIQKEKQYTKQHKNTETK